METVEVVIRIPKRTYDRVSKRGIIAYGDDAYYIGHAIANGTVLPKGHGKLNDSNILWNAFQDLGQDFYEAFDFAEANAVIDSDETESEE